MKGCDRVLLGFHVKNYKSFLNDTYFSMEAAPKQKGLDYSITSFSKKGKTRKILSTSVVYGPNAAGKSTLIGAMETMRAIIRRGHIRNHKDVLSGNEAANSLELIPNFKQTNNEPVEFGIDFFDDNMLFHYEMSLDLGSFLDVDYPRKVLFEQLRVDDEEVFTRSKKIEFNTNVKVLNLLDYQTDDYKVLESIASQSLREDELFLTNGFKLIYASSFAKKILDWIENKLVVIYDAERIETKTKYDEKQKPGIYVDPTLNDVAKAFGIQSNELGYAIKEDNNYAEMCSLIKDDERRIALPADMFESYGTIHFMHLLPFIIQTLREGSCLVVDELDASIHPMAIMSLLNVFHNDEINTNHAQLIFNTQNPMFLNSNIMRRDEIKFVERNEKTNISELYALSDFGTDGKNGVRKNEDYLKNYFISRYGAIREVDFAPAFEKIMASAEESK